MFWASPRSSGTSRPVGSELVFLQTPGSEELLEITCFPGSGPVHVQPDSHAPRIRGESLASLKNIWLVTA